jgi:hypothetical protein
LIFHKDKSDKWGMLNISQKIGVREGLKIMKVEKQDEC